MASGQPVAVIAAVDETDTLPRVLAELERLPLGEVIVVVNGPSDGPARVAAAAGATVIRYRERIGHDIGRAVGAARAVGAPILFLDADLPVPSADLRPFLEAVAGGVDVALNRIDPFIHPQARLHPVNAAKRFLNCALGRPDLGLASLTAIPNALSVRAVERIGPAALAVPPRAQAVAVLSGLRVEAVHPVDVVRPNARRPGLNLGHSSPVERLIVGDHLEAVGELVHRTGDVRGGFTDLERRRDLAP